MTREILKMALEALNSGEDVQIGRVVWTEYDSSLVQEAITAIEAALAQPEQWTPEDMAYRPDGLAQPEQYSDIVSDGGLDPRNKPEQEPVAWWDAKIGVFNEKHFDQLQPLYTSPKRQPLTTGEIDLLAGKNQNNDGTVNYLPFARAIEAAHGIGDKT
jgi:hypothetical protein